MTRGTGADRLTAAFCGALCLGLLLSAAAPAAAAPAVVLSRVEGEVTLVRDGREVPAKKMTACAPNDTVSTGDACKADLVWDGLWGCRVLPSSRMTITGVEREDMAMNLEKGSVLFAFRKLPSKSKFRVMTPTAIASVRGTKFLARVAEGSPEVFIVAQGTVMVQSLSGGEPSAVRAGEAFENGTARPATHEELDQVAEAGRIRMDLPGGKGTYSG